MFHIHDMMFPKLNCANHVVYCLGMIVTVFTSTMYFLRTEWSKQNVKSPQTLVYMTFLRKHWESWLALTIWKCWNTEMLNYPNLIHVPSLPVAFSFLLIFAQYFDSKVMTKLQVSASICLPAPSQFSRKASEAASWKHKLQKWKLSWSNMRKDKYKTKFVENSMFCVSVMFFIFTGWGLSVFLVSHSLTTQCHLPWLSSCLADMMFLPRHPAPPCNVFLESLLYMLSFNVRKKTLVRFILKKVFLLFFPQQNRRSLKKKKKFVTEESKESSPVMDCKATAITDNIPDSIHFADITHTNTHSTTHPHAFKTLEK